MIIKSCKGLTLVEMVISVTLLTVIILATVAIMDFGQKSFISTNSNGILQSDAQNAVMSISSLLRESSSFSVPSQTRINLIDKNQSIVLTGTQLNIIDSGTGSIIRTLSQSVNAVVFTSVTNGVFIDITFTTTAGNYRIKTTLYKRSA